MNALLQGWVLAGCLLAASAPLQAQTFQLQAWVTDEEGAPVEDAVVFVTNLSSAPPMSSKRYVMDQVGKEFIPRVLPVPVGSQVYFPNHDNIFHHVYSFGSGKTFELPLYKGHPAGPVVFDKAGVVRLGCNIHDWMTAYILVLPNPYFALTDRSGQARLAPASESEIELAVFHERLLSSVDETRKRARPGPETSKVSWRLPLKPKTTLNRSKTDYE